MMMKEKSALKNIKTKNPFTFSNQKIKKADDAILGKKEWLNIAPDFSKKIIKGKKDLLKMTIPVAGSKPLKLELKRMDILTESFILNAASNKDQPLESEMGLFYWGVVEGYENSAVVINIFNEEISGTIDTGDESFTLAKVNKSNQYILYQEKDLEEQPTLSCFSGDIKEELEEQVHTQAKLLPNPDNCVRMYVEVDYDLFLQFGSVTSTYNYIAGAFSQVGILYANESINFTLNQVLVWDTEDPYVGPDTGDYLDQLTAAVSGGFNGDLAHLVGTQGSGGIAYVNALCGNKKTGYSGINTSYQDVPSYSWTINVLTHEIGHNLGSPHTHSCSWNGNNTQIDDCGNLYAWNGGGTPGACFDTLNPIIPQEGGTIMSYCHLNSVGMDFNLGFGQQPGDLVRNNVYTATCLSPCVECTEIGNPCDDGNPCTISDAIDSYCNCTGVDTPDNDQDGFCGANDPDDADPCVPTSCDNCTLTTISFTADTYPDENSWEIINDQGVVVFSGTGYTGTPATEIRVVCISDGCYEFIMKDQYGDGICCAYGNGAYSVTDDLGNIIASGGEFGSADTTSFCYSNNTTNATCDFNNTPFANPVVGDVSTNDWDLEMNAFASFTLLGTNGGMPTNEGNVILNNDGTYTFTPTASFSGETSFQYEVCDDGAIAACDSSEVFIEVLPAVSAEGSSIIANFDANTIKSGTTGTGHILANDFDPDGRYLVVTTTLNGVTVSGIDMDGNTVADAGTLSIMSDGTYTFTPTGTFTGKVIQPYTISATSAPSPIDNSILEITVIEDTDNTTFANDDATVTDIGIEISHSVLQNDEDNEDDMQQVTSFSFDSDGDGDTETAGIIGSATTIGGTNNTGTYIANAGDLTLNADGTYTFLPTIDFSGNVLVTYTVCDNAITDSVCDDATLSISVLNASRDYGDYSTLYPTAWHRALTDTNGDNILDGTTDVWLGYSTSVETSMQLENDDDAITFGNGVGQFPTNPLPNTSYDINITVNSSSPDLVYYGLWIDWNADGIYEDFYSGYQNTASPAIATTTITTPATIDADVNIRLRADDDPLSSIDFQGGKTNGEVEDYRPATVLPVELISFFGRIKSCNSTLHWMVASEENFSHYEIERGTDGKSFTGIGSVQGEVNSSNIKAYQYDDFAVEEENYYRLKIVDLDGSVEYSDIIYLSSECSFSELKLFPNPASVSEGFLKVNIQSNKEKINFQIVDLFGRVVKTFSSDVEIGIINQINLDISNLPQGSYILKSTDGRSSKVFILME